MSPLCFHRTITATTHCLFKSSVSQLSLASVSVYEVLTQLHCASDAPLEMGSKLHHSEMVSE